MRTILTGAIMLVLAHGLSAAEHSPASAQSDVDKRPTRIWNRTGPLGEAVKRVTDACLLSDQRNEDGWVKYEPMSDEFDGATLDEAKWTVGMYWWKGRQPAARNVRHSLSVL